MALLQDLIQQIDDPALRERILQETNKLVKQKKFGLVFEEHLPECTPLYDVPIRVGSKVARKIGYVSDIYTVLKICHIFEALIQSQKRLSGSICFLKAFDIEKMFEPCRDALILFCLNIIP